MPFVITSVMEILFADSRLEKAILQDRPHPQLTASLALHARRRLRLLQAIPDMRTLQNLKSARFHPNAARNGVHRIGIVGGHHFRVRLDETLIPPAVTIIGIGADAKNTTRELAHETC